MLKSYLLQVFYFLINFLLLIESLLILSLLVISKMSHFWRLLGCAYVLGWRSALIFFTSYFMSKTKHRAFVSAIANQGAKSILKVVKASYQVEFADKGILKNGYSYIYMSNHRSLYDIPLLYAALATTIRPIVKSELFKIPIFGRALKKGECISVDRRNPASREQFIKQTKAFLASGISLLFFPEGTRSKSQDLLPFKTGGFHLAREAKVSIVPVGITNSNAILPAGKLTLSLNKEIIIRVGKPIEIQPYKSIDDQPKLIQQVKASIEELLVK